VNRDGRLQGVAHAWGSKRISSLKLAAGRVSKLDELARGAGSYGKTETPDARTSK
jgi:hypothetical protein